MNRPIDFTHIKYIKNVRSHDNTWAYKPYPVASYFKLNFKEGVGVDAHAQKLLKGSLIILSQKSPTDEQRYLTHVVELVNDGIEDKPQWETGTWGIFRWVKVHWIADFNNPRKIPIDKEVMKVNWGYEGTKAKLLDSPSLISEWKTIENLKTSLKDVLV